MVTGGVSSGPLRLQGWTGGCGRGLRWKYLLVSVSTGEGAPRGFLLGWPLPGLWGLHLSWPVVLL